jgi:hypothetical protein
MKISPGAHPDSYTMETESFLGVKRLRHGIHHPPHILLRLQREQNYTSTPHDFMAGCRVKFTFYFLETNVNLF